MAKSKKSNKQSTSAVSILFEAVDGTPSSPLCTPIRTDVDLILGKASDFAIKQTTPNEAMLTEYIFDSVIANLYLSLNKVLGKYPGATPIKKDEIDDTSTVGAVRLLAYKKCNVTCHPI